jgi:hypothetical protein
MSSRKSLLNLKEKSFKNSIDMKKLKKYNYYCILKWKQGKDIYEESTFILYKNYKEYKDIYYKLYDSDSIDEDFSDPKYYNEKGVFYGVYAPETFEDMYIIRSKYETKKNNLLHSLNGNNSVNKIYYERSEDYYGKEDDYDEHISEYHEDGILNNLYGFSKSLDVYPNCYGWSGRHTKDYYIKGVEYEKKEYEKIRDNIIKEKKELLINKLNSSNICDKQISIIISNYFY